MSDLTFRERRKHKRLKVSHRSAAITIANKNYPILEMSSGGFSSHCHDGSFAFDEGHPAYILLHGLSRISDVSIELAWQRREISPPGDSPCAPKIGFKFNGLNASQKLRLEAFLKWHTESPELRS